MVASRHDISVENEAEAVLSAALAQLQVLDRAFAATQDSRLISVREQAQGVVSQIKAAMQSGDLTASSLAALAASVNIGVDAASLAAESESAAIATKVELASASIASHATVSRMATDLFDRHEFDADVARHTQGAELEAFKKRQAESEKYIREQIGRGTSEGDLNASARMQGYMLDANAHGAGDNPDFQRKWDELSEKTDRLHAAIHAAGRSTEEYDKRVREDVIAFLKAKGMSDGEVEETVRNSKSPLGAVKPYLGGDSASASLANDIGRTGETEKAPELTVRMKPQAQERTLTIDLDAINAKLAGAGLDAPAGSDEGTGHGLAIQKPRVQDPISR